MSCTQSLVLRPAFELTVYWPFEEVYDGVSYDPATWVDKKAGSVITGFEADYFASGQIGHARRIQNWGVTYDPLLALNASDAGFSCWWWWRKNSAGNPTLRFQFDSNPVVPYHSLILQFNSATPAVSIWFDTYRSGGGTDSLYSGPFIPGWIVDWIAQDWVFCAITYTKADGMVRFYDGVSPAVILPGTATMDSTTQGRTGFSQIGGTSSADADEFGLSIKAPLTTAQIATLYNSGAGITWPAVNSL